LHGDVFGLHVADLRRQCPKDTDGRPIVATGDFAGATFADDVDFSDFVLRETSFDGATFNGEASFRGAHFVDEASFQSATFVQTASFSGATFSCPARFQYEEGSRRVGHARQREVTFGGWADFRTVRFDRGAWFAGADFEGRARFGAARFGTMKHPAGGSFEGARFARARTFGPLLVHGELLLDRAVFEAPGVRIAISASSVSCIRTLFVARTTMELRCEWLTLEDSEFSQPSIVGGSPSPFTPEAADAVLDDSALGLMGWRPQIRSLSRANVANLTLSDCDLAQCSFIGAHNLDGLRLEAVTFDYTKRPKTRRPLIVDESDRRAEPGRLARTYRALRKGREDSKDAPGAAGFYYGETEMRRKEASGVEWLVLTAYWLVSGYGLRAWRALAALAVTIALFAWGFQAFGFNPDQAYWRSFLFSVESTSSLFRGQTVVDASTLTDVGHILQIGLRLLGPLFLGLAILALRGRVKR
jgi:uncharacterized protein YjbI with pentapeptide repeats